MVRKIILIPFFLFFLSTQSFAATVIIEGDMNEFVEIEQNQSFTIPSSGLKKLVFRFANPTSFASPTVKQEVKDYSLAYNPKPSSVEAETDSFGNKFTKVTWLNINRNAEINGKFAVAMNISLKELVSAALFPLKEIDQKEKRFLSVTPLVQADNPRIKELANNLSKGAKTEESAVIQILNWVVDNVKYTTNPPQYDAIYTLDTGTGNCQNFSHLSIALLRAVGIPARIVGGITLSKSWKVPLKNGTLVQSIGQGGHAWLEVYYQDIGWVPYDAQQSHLFVSPRHIKQTIGLDAKDINDSWLASPTLPPFREDIQANFVRDDIKLSLKDIKTNPSNYILTNAIIAHVAKPVIEVPPVEKPKPKPPKVMERIEFGNMAFPSFVDIFTKSKGEELGYKTLDKETAEYVTSEYTYAQAFSIERPLRIDEINLAMHKFGGRAGSLWIDVVKDEKGKPSMEGIRSYPLNLDTIKYFPGYQWFPFKFSKESPVSPMGPLIEGDRGRQGQASDNPVVAPGRYWIILRRSKDAIVNWFYIPGNPYGDADDTLSTAQGIDWSNILNYDFNFKVTGMYVE